MCEEPNKSKIHSLSRSGDVKTTSRRVYGASSKWERRRCSVSGSSSRKRIQERMNTKTAPGNIILHRRWAKEELELQEGVASKQASRQAGRQAVGTVLLAEVDALQMINDIWMIFNISRCSSFTKSAGQNNKLLYCIIRLVRPLSVCPSVFCHVTLCIL